MLAAEAVVRGTLLAAVVVVLFAAAFQVLVAVRGLLRLRSRVIAYTTSPVANALAKARGDVARLEAALVARDLLLARARAALTTIRHGGLPPGALARLARLRDEYAAFIASRR
jgi:hypothetical protein